VKDDREHSVAAGHVFAFVPRPVGLVLVQGEGGVATTQGTLTLDATGAVRRFQCDSL
jgi:hypothetical protein